MNFDAAIFDLDGTLLDTLGVWDGILAAPLERRGLPCPPDYWAIRKNAILFQTNEKWKKEAPKNTVKNCFPYLVF